MGVGGGGFNVHKRTCRKEASLPTRKINAWWDRGALTTPCSAEGLQGHTLTTRPWSTGARDGEHFVASALQPCSVL